MPEAVCRALQLESPKASRRFSGDVLLQCLGFKDCCVAQPARSGPNSSTMTFIENAREPG